MSNLMYQFEHQLIPQWINRTPAFFNDMVKEGEQATLFRQAASFFERQGEQLPYSQEDFGGTHFRIDDNTVVVMMKMPEPEVTPLCHRIYMFLDTRDNRTGCYTLEKGSDPITGKELMFVCGWSADGRHENYGNFFLENFAQTVNLEIRIFYSKFYGLNSVSIPLLLSASFDTDDGVKCRKCSLDMHYDLNEMKEGSDVLILCPECMTIETVKFDGEKLIRE